MITNDTRTSPLDLTRIASPAAPSRLRTLTCVGGCGHTERVPHDGNPSGLVCRNCMSPRPARRP